MYAPLPFKSYKCITAALNQFLQVEEEIPYFIGVTLFSGLGLIIYHLLKKDNKE